MSVKRDVINSEIPESADKEYKETAEVVGSYRYYYTYIKGTLKGKYTDGEEVYLKYIECVSIKDGSRYVWSGDKGDDSSDYVQTITKKEYDLVEVEV